MNKLLVALGIVLSTSTSTLAVELTNKDSQSYKVKITEGSRTTEISIEPGAKQKVCNSACQIDVDGIGSINAIGTEVLTLENGAIVLPEIAL